MKLTRGTFINMALHKIGGNLDGQTRLAMHARILQEWGGASDQGPTDNPLDLTEFVTGATPFNTFDGDLHVWNYRNLNDGLEAWHTIMGQKVYQGVLLKLRIYTPASEIIEEWNKTPWGYCDPALIGEIWHGRGIAFYDALLVPDAS